MLKRWQISVIEKLDGWEDFVDAESSASKNKRLLLKMARDREPRPSFRNSLGGALSRYTLKCHACYDVDFDTQIRAIAPYWFSRYYMPFGEAKSFVHAIGLKTCNEWREYCKSKQIPSKIPTNPNRIYTEWMGWGDWLGTNAVAAQNMQYKSFEDARAFVRQLGLKGTEEWKIYARSGTKPNDIPKIPYCVYADEWESWSDWLGLNRAVKGKCLSFDTARAYVRSLKLKNVDEWKSWCKSENKPLGIPNCPEKVYKGKGWAGIKDWLGTVKSPKVKKEKIVFLSFGEAKLFVKSLGLTGESQWREYCKNGKPTNIPSAPSVVYKDEWVSWGDWLGTGKIRNADKEFLEYHAARKIIVGLGLRNQKQWFEYRTSGNKPDNIPSNPEKYYPEWSGLADWIGGTC